MDNHDKNSNPWMYAAYISGAGTMLAVYIVIGYLGARWLAERFDGPNYWVAIGSIVGLLLGITNISIIFYKFMEEQDG
ncbi:AtpZ/AtpI family protein [Paenibacillus aceti]|uniref:ATPase F0F1 n=1 Tax=Paenibacillus aceti TaxID=1820010 RepID=A0ABQ1VTR5_9BACL|nr:AtpZ/AtpI family protein [Paenibacillus aceti]GGF95875.1 hypothetical protein GCM10010913_16860 [Paenibacillus aceti]